VRSHGRDRKTPIFIASVLPTGIDDISSLRRNDTPDGLAATGRLIAAALRGTSSSEDDAAASEFIRLATAALAEAKTPLIISGTGCGSRSLIEAAGAISQSLQALGCSSSLLLVPPEANSLGCGLLGGGLSLDEALDLARRGDLIVAENDLFRRAEPAQVSEVLDTLSNLVVLDSLDTRTASRADLVFPAATFAESSGTFVNLETRAQRFYAALRPAADIAPSWRWLSEAAVLAGRTDMDWTHIDEVSEAAATGRLAGLADAISGASSERKIPRSSHRFSGRTAMYADRNIHEPKTPVDQETPLAWSMEGQLRDQPSDLLPFVWAPGWNSNQAVFKFQQEVGGAASGGDGGIRMITDDAVGTWAPASSKAAYAGPDPAPESAFSLIPVQLIFGSDELSARSPAIAERIPTAFVVLSPADANRLDVAAGGGVRCAALDRTLEVRIEPAMRSGFAALAQGLADLFVVSGQTVELVPDPNYKAPDYRAPGDSSPGNPSNIIARE
jgi:NADH-quinone oxidoreductase subunit G